jgi:tetratricopeptide (TPR) repeat protein
MMILALNNMADGLIKAGDFVGALSVLDRGTALAEKYLGTANPLYHNIATTRAEALSAAGHTAESHALYDRVIALELDAKSAILGPTLGSRAQRSIAEKKWAEAASFAQRSVTAIESFAGKDSPDLWMPLATLGQATLELGRPGEARAYLERAIAIGEKAQVSPSDLAPIRKLLAR